MQAFLLTLVTDEARRSTNLTILERFGGRQDGSRLSTTQATESLDQARDDREALSQRGRERHPVIVIDASVLANALTDDGPVGAHGRAQLSRRPTHWVAPEHLVVEVSAAIQGQWLGQKISKRRAVDALSAMAAATIDLVTAARLLDRMWELRRNVTGYDAAYLAVAETFGCALVTADVRLTRVPDLRCEVRLALPAA